MCQACENDVYTCNQFKIEQKNNNPEYSTVFKMFSIRRVLKMIAKGNMKRAGQIIFLAEIQYTKLNDRDRLVCVDGWIDGWSCSVGELWDNK